MTKKPSWISVGWEEAEAQAASSQIGYTRNFFIRDGEEARIRVLSDEPTGIKDHYIKGKGYLTCAEGFHEQGCPLCAAGDRPSNRFIFQVFDPREYTDKNDIVHKDEVKIWRVGIKLLRLLKLKEKRYGPLDTYNIDVTRLGTGNNTTYSIDIDIDSIDKEFTLPAGQELYDLNIALEPRPYDELVSIANSLSGVVQSKSTGLFDMSDVDDTDDDDEVEKLWGKG